MKVREKRSFADGFQMTIGSSFGITSNIWINAIRKILAKSLGTEGK